MAIKELMLGDSNEIRPADEGSGVVGFHALQSESTANGRHDMLAFVGNVFS